MESIIQVIEEGYIIITLGCVILGYVVTTTPHLDKVKDFVPLLVTLVGMGLGLTFYGKSLDVAVYGALSGIISTGLYELFGKGITNLGKYLEERGFLVKKGGDK